MDWDDLRIFDAAARAGSLGVAARRLGMSQPQVSRRLRGLEASLGARLFDRTPQGLRHTEAGKRLAALCAPMAEAADAIASAKPQIAENGVTIVRLALD